MATRHILLVEDEAPLREVVAEELSDRGYHVEQAASGEEAIDRLASFAFDIVITDLRLGGGADGTAVLHEARAVYPDIIGIIVTGYGTVKDPVEAIKRGAADFVTKPFQFDELLHALNSALEQRRLKSSLTLMIIQFNEKERSLGNWKYFLVAVMIFLSVMMVSRVKYPTFKGLGLSSTSTFVKAVVAAAILGFVFVLRDKILYYVLPALFTAYLVYGFIRPRISRQMRREIEEEDDDQNSQGAP